MVHFVLAEQLKSDENAINEYVGSDKAQHYVEDFITGVTNEIRAISGTDIKYRSNIADCRHIYKTENSLHTADLENTDPKFKDETQVQNALFDYVRADVSNALGKLSDVELSHAGFSLPFRKWETCEEVAEKLHEIVSGTIEAAIERYKDKSLPPEIKEAFKKAETAKEIAKR